MLKTVKTAPVTAKVHNKRENQMMKIDEMTEIKNEAIG